MKLAVHPPELLDISPAQGGPAPATGHSASRVRDGRPSKADEQMIHPDRGHAYGLLQAGAEYIWIYGDGSFHNEIGVGAWAFRVAEFGLNRAAVEAGSGIEVFEFAALLRGIEAVRALDRTVRPIHVYPSAEPPLNLSPLCGSPARSRSASCADAP
jgi:hypothetical protein